MVVFVKKHPVLTYYIATFVISWVAILAVIGPRRFLGAQQIPDSVLTLVYPAALTGPMIAGLLLTGVVDGKAGFRDLGSRLIKWRVSARWYAVAFLTAPLLATATLLALLPMSGAFRPSILSAGNKAGVVLGALALGLMVGLFEEIGWTGFATPKMRLTHGVVATGLIMGLLWGAWHFPLFAGSSASSGSIPPALYVLVLLFAFLPPYRVLIVWVYEHTQSVLLAILMHAPLVGIQSALIPASLSGATAVAFNLLFASVLWLTVAGIAVFERRPLAQAS